MKQKSKFSFFRVGMLTYTWQTVISQRGHHALPIFLATCTTIVLQAPYTRSFLTHSYLDRQSRYPCHSCKMMGTEHRQEQSASLDPENLDIELRLHMAGKWQAWFIYMEDSWSHFLPPVAPFLCLFVQELFLNCMSYF